MTPGFHILCKILMGLALITGVVNLLYISFTRFHRTKTKEKTMYTKDIERNLEKIKIYHIDKDEFITSSGDFNTKKYWGNILIPKKEGRADDRYAQWINHDGKHYCNLSKTKFRWFCQVLPQEAHIYEYDKNFTTRKQSFINEMENCDSKKDVIKVLAKYWVK